MKKRTIYLVIHNVRSALNVGSMFRTADAAGVEKIYLCGYTPTPEHPKVAKTALGAEKSVPWEHHVQTHRLLEFLQKQGIRIAALERFDKLTASRFGLQTKNIFKYRPKFPLALIVGNEVRGLSPAILKRCQNVLEIPMYGQKESLNVSVAAGIALYALVKK